MRSRNIKLLNLLLMMAIMGTISYSLTGCGGGTTAASAGIQGQNQSTFEFTLHSSLLESNQTYQVFAEDTFGNILFSTTLKCSDPKQGCPIRIDNLDHSHWYDDIVIRVMNKDIITAAAFISPLDYGGGVGIQVAKDSNTVDLNEYTTGQYLLNIY